jgi:hypothetical protein
MAAFLDPEMEEMGGKESTRMAKKGKEREVQKGGRE